MAISYRSRRFFRRLSIFILTLVLLAAVLAVCWFLWLDRYVIYTSDGAKLDFELSLDFPAGQPAQRPSAGETVQIYYPEDDEYREIRLVTTLRNDVFKDCISQDSPFGKALMGKKVGQTVTVHVNAAVSYPVKILEVIKGEDDPDLPISTY